MRKPRATRKGARAERNQEAGAFRLRGWPFRAIAARLGFKGAKAACRAVLGGLKRTPEEPLDEVRKLELARLDALLNALWDSATGGDGPAVDRVLKVLTLRTKLLGLDGPAAAEGSATGPAQIILTWSDDVGNGD